jgi:hypothetical protein
VSIGIPLSDMTMDQFMDIEVVDAGRQGLGPGAMRDRVWDRLSLAVRRTNNNK